MAKPRHAKRKAEHGPRAISVIIITGQCILTPVAIRHRCRPSRTGSCRLRGLGARYSHPVTRVRRSVVDRMGADDLASS